MGRFAFFRQIARPQLMGAIFAATGVGFAAVLAQMRRLLFHALLEEFPRRRLVKGEFVCDLL
jgi:hypothetical protein